MLTLAFRLIYISHSCYDITDYGIVRLRLSPYIVALSMQIFLKRCITFYLRIDW
jgi:hypothetical protein